MATRRKRIILPFQVLYYGWGHTTRIKYPDARGTCATLQEAYANACRHLGRGSIYYKAVIVDREQELIMAILRRKPTTIAIEER